MNARMILVMVLAMFSMNALAGDYDYRLQKTASKLYYVAKSYNDEVHHYSDSGKLNRAAYRFVQAAERFCYLVEQGASNYELEKAHHAVESRYYKLYKRASRYGYSGYGHKSGPNFHKVKYAFNDFNKAVNYQINEYAYNRKHNDHGVFKGRSRNGRVGFSFGYRY